MKFHYFTWEQNKDIYLYFIVKYLVSLGLGEGKEEA